MNPAVRTAALTLSGLISICLAAAVLGLGFDFIDATRGLAAWMTFPVILLAIIVSIIIAVFGFGLIGRAVGADISGTPRVAIDLDGGLVQQVFSTVPIEVAIVDYDTDGADPAELTEFDGDHCFPRVENAEIDAHAVSGRFDAAARRPD